MENQTMADLSSLNFEEAKRQIPLSIFLGILAVVGFTGNALVLYIYGRLYTTSNSRVFIVCLAMVDITTCALALPVEIVTVLNQYEFDQPIICKFSRFVNSLTTVSSSIILILIAIDRHRKICQPIRWQISNKNAKILCALAVVLSILFNWPLLILYGKKTVNLQHFNLTGSECSVDDSWKSSIYPLMHNIASLGTFLLGVLVLVILYSLIGRKVRFFAKKSEFREASSDTIDERSSTQQQQRRQKIESANKEFSSKLSVDGNLSVCEIPDVGNMKGNRKQSIQSKISDIPMDQSNEVNQMSQSLDNIISDQPNRNNINEKGKGMSRLKRFKETSESSQSRRTGSNFGLARIATLKIRVSRIRKSRKTKTGKFLPSRKKLAKSTTYLMFVITLAFILSFVPYLFLVVIRELNKTFVDNLTDVERAVYRFFLRSYFLNCAVNPILYSIFDMRFRKAFKTVMSDLRAKCSCSRDIKV